LFIVESYKKLSPDSGDKTTDLLTQISQQLAGFKNNAYPSSQDTASFSPTTSILFVNALWFLSLIIAITSAFYVMLVQQWIRRYTQTLEELGGDQEHIRSRLFLGTQRYHMSHAIGFIPLPLHVSVFLFFSGLIIFLFTISHAMATVVTIAVGIVGLLYLGLTILPIFDDVCPYFTPMSGAAWYLWHIYLIAAAFCVHRLLGLFRAGGRPLLGEVWSHRPGKLSKWSDTLEEYIYKNKERLKTGLRGKHSQAVAAAVDLKALTWLLKRPAMADNSKFQDFVKSIPEQTLVQLSSLDAESGEKTIRDHLSSLFQSCIHRTYRLDETARSQRLLICLNAFHHIVKPSTLPDEIYEAVLDDVWSNNFKDIESVRELWTNSDLAIRVNSRSICAHLARNLFRKPPFELGELERRWLQEVVGQPESALFGSVHLSTQDHFNLQSFVFGVLSSQKDDLLIDHATRFAETLAVLMNAGSSGALSREIFSEEISSFIEWSEKSDYQHRDKVAAKLRKMFRDFFTETAP
jgi:hypothetical protein